MNIPSLSWVQTCNSSNQAVAGLWLRQHSYQDQIWAYLLDHNSNAVKKMGNRRFSTILSCREEGSKKDILTRGGKKKNSAKY
jgi:hypothetical protein